nr:MAG TPA: hypothetical protein [Caudoviricetes sp.]
MAEGARRAVRQASPRGAVHARHGIRADAGPVRGVRPASLQLPPRREALVGEDVQARHAQRGVGAAQPAVRPVRLRHDRLPREVPRRRAARRVGLAHRGGRGGVVVGRAAQGVPAAQPRPLRVRLLGHHRPIRQRDHPRGEMTMEITDCEQYVLAELDCERRRNERLVAENNKLAKQLDAMTKRANGYRRIINRPKTPIEALADKVMREEMLTRFTYAEVTDVKSAFSGRLLDFDEWCHDAMRYVALADDVGEEEFARFMRRDLKKIYDKKVAERAE